MAFVQMIRYDKYQQTINGLRYDDRPTRSTIYGSAVMESVLIEN